MQNQRAYANWENLLSEKKLCNLEAKNHLFTNFQKRRLARTVLNILGIPLCLQYILYDEAYQASIPVIISVLN